MLEGLHLIEVNPGEFLAASNKFVQQEVLVESGLFCEKSEFSDDGGLVESEDASGSSQRNPGTKKSEERLIGSRRHFTSGSDERINKNGIVEDFRNAGSTPDSPPVGY